MSAAPRRRPLATRLFRLSQRLLPAELRERHGAEMREWFEHRRASARERGRLAAGWFVTVACFDNVRTAIAHRRRDGTSVTWADSLDGLRALGRSWRRQPLWTAAVVLVLAAPIAVTTTAVSLMDATVLGELPYPDADRVVAVWASLSGEAGPRSRLSGPELDALAGRPDLFEASGGVWSRFATLQDDRGPVHVDVGYVSSGLLPAVAVHPALGAWPTASDDVDGAAPVVVLGHHVWTESFGADPGVIGTLVDINGVATTIVAVMPERFRLFLPAEAALPDPIDVWLPWGGGYAEMDPDWHLFAAVGRVREGVSTADVNDALAGVASDLSTRIADVYGERGLTLTAESMRVGFVAPLRASMALMLGASIVLLLVACANVAGLLLMRGADRAGELSLRRALGATRARLVREQLAAHTGLFVVAALSGLLLARVATAAFLGVRPPDLDLLHPPTLNRGVLLAVLALVGGFSAISAVLPAILVGGAAGRAAGAGSRTATGSRGRIRGGLVVTEVALSVVLLIGGGLMLRTVSALSEVPRGFEPEGVLTFRLSISGPEYPYEAPTRISGFYDQLVDRLADVPGVSSVGATEQLPLIATDGGAVPYAWQRSDGVVPWGQQNAHVRPVSSRYLETIGAELIEGRGLQPSDDVTAPLVAVVDETLARRAWPGRSALGERVQLDVFVNGVDERRWAQVVGVVRHVKLTGLAVAPTPQIWLHHAQSPRRSMSLALATAGDPGDVVEPVRAAAREVAPARALFDIVPMSAYLDRSMASVRFLLSLVGSFSAIAFVLAILGLYGMVAYSVGRARREIGIRLALGAAPRRIGTRIVAGALRVAGLGALCGVVLAIPSTRALESVVYGVTPLDPSTYGAVVIGLLGVSLLACVMPVRTALAVDPRESLADG